MGTHGDRNEHLTVEKLRRTRQRPISKVSRPTACREGSAMHSPEAVRGCLANARALVLKALLEVEARSEIMAGRVWVVRSKDRDNVEHADKRRTTVRKSSA